MYPDVFIHGGLGFGKNQNTHITDYFYDIFSFDAGTVSVCHASVDRGDGKCEYAQQGRLGIYEYRFCFGIFDHDVSWVHQ